MRSINRKFSLETFQTFIRGDAMNILRDPLMQLIMFVPVLMVLLVLFGIPYLDEIITDYTAFRVTAHSEVISALVILMTPMMVSMVTGFLLLDEKDEGIISYMGITPLGKNGYLQYRMSMPGLLACLISLIIAVVLLFGNSINWFYLFFSIAMASLISPLLTMYLATLAKNKVEGMAYAKLISLLMVAPLISYLSDSPWTIITYLIPITWGAEAIYAGITNSTFGAITNWWLLIIGGLVIHSFFIAYFHSHFKKSI
ncbi:hypothetical protein ACM26V_07145 [Salipaludibacillus sp. HK11]|uniref:hypothetical protein n=1 Tax=Salipaludibacillus sp. HK11 TaxID=3394320 RepID=UPI0039FBCB34